MHQLYILIEGVSIDCYLGLIVVIVSPDLDATNSLLMKRPRGCVYLRPFGAVSSTKRSDMLPVLKLREQMQGLDEVVLKKL